MDVEGSQLSVKWLKDLKWLCFIRHDALFSVKHVGHRFVGNTELVTVSTHPLSSCQTQVTFEWQWQTQLWLLKLSFVRMLLATPLNWQRCTWTLTLLTVICMLWLWLIFGGCFFFFFLQSSSWGKWSNKKKKKEKQMASRFVLRLCAECRADEDLKDRAGRCFPLIGLLLSSIPIRFLLPAAQVKLSPAWTNSLTHAYTHTQLPQKQEQHRGHNKSQRRGIVGQWWSYPYYGCMKSKHLSHSNLCRHWKSVNLTDR